MREAFTYMFKDNCFLKKAFVYYVLTFVSCALFAYADINSCSGGCVVSTTPQVVQVNSVNLVVYRILATLLTMFTVGYFFTSVKALIEQSNNYVLPFFNFGANFVKGLKFLAGAVTTILALSIIIALFGLFGAHVITILTALVLLFYLIFSISFAWRFANGGTFLTFLNWKGVVKTVLESPKNYFKYWIIAILVSFVSAFITSFVELFFSNLINDVTATMICSVLVTSFIEVYIAFVLMNLIAKSIKPSVV